MRTGSGELRLSIPRTITLCLGWGGTGNGKPSEADRGTSARYEDCDAVCGSAQHHLRELGSCKPAEIVRLSPVS